MKREIGLPFVFFAMITALAVTSLFVSNATSSSYSGVSAKVGPAYIYPSVPGSINPTIYQGNIQTTICVTGFTGRPGYRPGSNYTTALKIKQLEIYGYTDQKTADYEEDHLISLELGGNPTDPNNLWPEPYTAPISDGGAKTKDQVENYLHRQVCAGTMTLAEAQKEVSTDWYAVYVNKIKGKYGSVDSFDDPDDE